MVKILGFLGTAAVTKGCSGSANDNFFGRGAGRKPALEHVVGMERWTDDERERVQGHADGAAVGRLSSATMAAGAGEVRDRGWRIPIWAARAPCGLEEAADLAGVAVSVVEAILVCLLRATGWWCS